MDLANYVSYERDFELPIVDPADFQAGKANPKLLGITLWVKHIDCESAVDIMRGGSASDVAKGASAKEKAPGTDPRDMYAACVSRWDWGEHQWDGETPEFSIDKSVEIFRDPRAAWMLRQVMVGTQNIGNFTSS